LLPWLLTTAVTSDELALVLVAHSAMTAQELQFAFISFAGK